MKQVLDLRPVYHRLEGRIRAHVLLCWLALLLARIVETQAATPRPGHDLALRPRRTGSPARGHVHRVGAENRVTVSHQRLCGWPT